MELLFYGTQNFSTLFIRACHWTFLSQINPFHTHTTYFLLRLISILSLFYDQVS
jgi:hypothetical protein